MWPFSRKPVTPPPPPPTPEDCRVWNEDWRIGDTAECIVDGINTCWHDDLPPWQRPALGAQFTVIGFKDGFGGWSGRRMYFLKLEGWPVAISCTAFRKVRPVATEQSEVVSRILNAKPGADNPRETARMSIAEQRLAGKEAA